jgi:diphthamide biosynthesis methyltransferase
MDKERDFMNQNSELLNYIYQNSQKGIHTVRQLIDIAEDECRP